MTGHDYLTKWIKETYPLMDSSDYIELDYCDMQKFAAWLVELLTTPIDKDSLDDKIDAELERRSIVQYNDDHDDEPHWDEGKLYWARKMFNEGAKWAVENYFKL
jgi:hypothetical protein